MHAYRQLISEFSASDFCRVQVLRSVMTEQDFPRDSLRAYTLAPTGDVFHWQDGVLHWHHICTVAGVGIMPTAIEWHVMNLVRWLGFDKAERKTYREEAEGFIRWSCDPAAVVSTWQTLPSQQENMLLVSNKKTGEIKP